MITKSLSIDLILNVTINTPLKGSFNDKIKVKLNHMTLIYEIFFSQKSNKWGIGFKLTTLDL